MAGLSNSMCMPGKIREGDGDGIDFGQSLGMHGFGDAN
jgi:hypothetical protein